MEINKKRLKIIEKLNEINGWFSDKTNKINESLASLTNKIKERAQTNKIRNEKEEVNTNTTEIKMIILSICFVNNYASTNWTIWKKWINV